MRKADLIKAAVFLVVAAIAASLLNGIEYVALVALAAAIHESGHILAAKALKVPSAGGGATFFGLSLKYDFSGVPYAKEAAVSAAGALFNVAASLVTVLLVKEAGDHAVFFIFSNLSLALFNLLPISPLDGSGLLTAILCIFLSPRTAYRAAAWTSAVFSVAFFVFTVYVQLKVGANMSLMFISVFLLYNAFANVKK